MHAQIVPPLVHALTQLRHVLAKAQQHAESKGWDTEVLLGLRLAPDMLPLLRQVQITTDVAKNAAGRLSASESPSFDDSETRYAELDPRLLRALDFIESVAPTAFEGAEKRAIRINSRRGELSFNGHNYLYQFVLPNVHFHTSITYALLRQAGVPLGKADFLGPVGVAG